MINEVDLLLVFITLLLLAFTVLRAYQKRTTVSRNISNRSIELNSIPFFVGTMCGHWFVLGIPWAVHELKFTVIPLSVVIVWDIVFNVLNQFFIFPRLLRHPAFYFVGGLVSGSLLWNQSF